MDRNLLHDSIVQNASFTFARSGGRGGQNVNKVNTKVLARLPLSRIAGLAEREAEALVVSLRGRLNGALELCVSASDTRSQEQNRAIALARLESLIVRAGRVKAPRIKTKPTKASRERRLRAKRILSERKRARRADFRG